MVEFGFLPSTPVETTIPIEVEHDIPIQTITCPLKTLIVLKKPNSMVALNFRMKPDESGAFNDEKPADESSAGPTLR